MQALEKGSFWNLDVWQAKEESFQEKVNFVFDKLLFSVAERYGFSFGTYNKVTCPLMTERLFKEELLFAMPLQKLRPEDIKVLFVVYDGELQFSCEQKDILVFANQLLYIELGKILVSANPQNIISSEEKKKIYLPTESLVGNEDIYYKAADLPPQEKAFVYFNLSENEKYHIKTTSEKINFDLFVFVEG